MRCPFCNNSDSDVVDSRSCDDGDGIKRRRKCTQCEKRFTTYERVVEEETVSKKKEIQEQKKGKPIKNIYDELKRDHDYPVDDYNEVTRYN